MIVGALAMDLVMEGAPDNVDKHPSVRSAWNFMLGVGTLFAISAFAQALFTYHRQ